MRLDISVDLWWRLMVEKQFTNKVVIVTGGSQGIGFACAKRFQEEGAIVCVIQRSQSKNFESYEFDLSKEKDCLKRLSLIRADFKVINMY